MLDYDAEADRYDETRGGVPRARAAADAVLRLVPPGARTLLDLACGTGLVTKRLARPGLRVYGADTAPGMARKAAERVPGSIVLADARRLPLPDASVDAVSAVWLLHLLPFSAAVVAEAARVLRPGGVLVTTVDKDAAHDVGCDIDRVLAPHRSYDRSSDRADLIDARAAAHGLTPSGATRFTGHGQGNSPRGVAEKLRSGYFASWFRGDAETAGALVEQLAALPDQDRPRDDPAYRLVSYRRPLRRG
ncbi:class I SAM-dependent methyltransferase [Streptomyces vilmorinianum]|uniref:class I SAM-dependent methyltransferase n=1 Tax=Streptomyces vilmorinianum TaxID=3051092 RepID=UPI0010FB0A9C|nr:class I SAM-dependent methyltransferase [Streptomyces vilmorinianum]